MKKIILFLTSALLFCACSDFLEEKSQDKVIPKEPNHFRELIFGELIFGEVFDLEQNIELMSDNVGSIYFEGANDEDKRVNKYQYYTWQANTELSYSKEEVPDKMYEQLYAGIVLCNAIESELSDVNGTAGEMARLYAEVYFFRAFYYYYLANLYGTPYTDSENAVTTKCVPINNNNGIAQETYLRSSQKQVYNLMIRDITKSIEKFKESTGEHTVFRPNHDAACILASRIFLTTKQYDKVVEYADMITGLENLYNLPEFVMKYGRISDINEGAVTDYKFFMNIKNPEIAFSFNNGSSSEAFIFQQGSSAGAFIPSKELLDSYESNDLRKNVFFDENGMIAKFYMHGEDVYRSNMRTTEALLNKAEALAHINESAAISILNKLRASRFQGEAPALTGDVMDNIKAERFKELCFDGLRWFDLRRWGMPQIVHEYPLADGARKHVYTLEQGDAGYTLALPMAVTLVNDKIENHSRPQRNGVVVDL